jgi:transcriptional regulator with XRE-family HTH domain
MWRAVGEHLQRVRLARKWTRTDVERAGGPSYKTVQAIEDGEVGNVESLDKCATALGLSLPDIINAVLEARETPLSPEAALIVKKFNETTIAGRTALLQVAYVLPPVRATAGTGPKSEGSAAPRATPRSPRPPRPGPPGAGRRTAD